MNACGGGTVSLRRCCRIAVHIGIKCHHVGGLEQRSSYGSPPPPPPFFFFSSTCSRCSLVRGEAGFLLCRQRGFAARFKATMSSPASEPWRALNELSSCSDGHESKQRRSPFAREQGAPLATLIPQRWREGIRHKGQVCCTCPHFFECRAGRKY